MFDQPDHETIRAIRKGLGMSQAEFAAAIGVSKSSIELYERGTRRDDGRSVEIPQTVWLAIAAIKAGLTGVDRAGHLVRTYFVTPNGEGWSIMLGGVSIADYPTKALAEVAATEIAKQHRVGIPTTVHMAVKVGAGITWRIAWEGTGAAKVLEIDR